MFPRLTRALGALLILMTGFNPALAADSRPFSKPDTVLRGNANGMRAIVQGYTGGTGNWSQVSRTRHITKTGFCSAAAVMPMFIPTGTPIADAELKSGYTVQVGVEYPYVNANASIPPRAPLKWDAAGSATGTFTPNGKTGYLRGVQTALPFCVPAGSYYGLWTTIEATGRAGVVGGILPWTHALSNFNQRYTGAFTANTSQIDAGTALTATSITQAPSVQTGGVQAYAPAMLLTPYKAGEKAPGSEGDSISYGVNEGAGGSSTFGDVEGSPQSSSGGFVTRGITDTLGLNVAVQLARPTDGAKFKSLPGGFRYRGQLLQIANPTHLIVEDIQNDTNPSTSSNIVAPSAWVASTYVNRFETRTSNSNVYVAVVPGVTSSTAPSHTTGTAADNTVTWLYWGPNTNGYPLSGVIYARQAQMQALYRQLVPGVKITRTFGTPYSSSSFSISSLTASGTSATATHAASVATGAVITVAGATPSTYNGTFTVTAVDGTHFTYTTASAPGTSATGTVTGSDSWATAVNQTPVNAPPNSAQSILKQFYRTTAGDTFLGTDAYWDPNVGIEDSYTGTQATESAKWPSTGTANDNTIDGVHGTSRFYSAAGATATPSILP